MMKNVFPMMLLMGFCLVIACKDKNAKASDADISSLPIHTSDPTNPMSVASKLEHATSAVKNATELEWYGNVDPVCNMKIKETVEDTMHLDGKIYGFCCAGCKESFQDDPQKWLDKAKKE